MHRQRDSTSGRASTGHALSCVSQDVSIDDEGPRLYSVLNATIERTQWVESGLQPPPQQPSSAVSITTFFDNAKNLLLANEAMWRGSVDEASVHVREVISRAIALGATAIIIVHNHPSGDPSPSQQDIRLTRDLIEAGRHMKVTVHDHVIVGSQGRTSMKALGLI